MNNTLRLVKNVLVIVVIGFLFIIIAVLWKENGILIAHLQVLSNQQALLQVNKKSSDNLTPSPQNRGFIQAADLPFEEGRDTVENPLEDVDVDNELLLLQKQLQYLVELKNELEKK